MVEKSDDETWYEYLYSDEFTADERGDLRDEFFALMADETREILDDSELDESRYQTRISTHLYVGSDDEWLMDEQKDAEELRDVLAGEVGDESVGVFVTPRSSEGKIAEIPDEDHIPVDEYSVFVELTQVQEDLEDTMGAVKGELNEAVGGE
ncbi:hypothetical protein [Haloplanus sp. C73]|uniref:hypothetical protein n=1 Tax=Haloplanus sp. C73 TaxID=3421641 RepID=UPI003EBE0CF7